MDVIITLTTIGTDAGATFDLYSDVDGYAVAFDTGILAATLLGGYTASVPDGATTIRVQGDNVECPYTLDIPIIYTTTTTTSIADLNCGGIVSYGSVNVIEYPLLLEGSEGLILLDFEYFGIPEKVEIIHAGTKVATSGMTTVNAGPFDNLYGDPTVPTFAETLTVDQFIGTAKGLVPSREAALLSDTGYYYIPAGQVIWWQYTFADILVDAYAYVRITSTDTGGDWTLTRICTESTTTTTTSTSTTTTTTTLAPTTTTTTTTLTGLEQASISSTTNVSDACSEILDSICWIDTSVANTISVGDKIYNNIGGTNPLVGNGNYYHIKITTESITVSARVDATGTVLSPISICP